MSAERDAFEKWITSPPFEREVTRFPDSETETAWPGQYRTYEVQLAWEAWREAAKENAALRAERDALRKVLADADELERYTRTDGHREWAHTATTWLHPDDAIVILSAKALDAARKEAKP